MRFGKELLSKRAIITACSHCQSIKYCSLVCGPNSSKYDIVVIPPSINWWSSHLGSIIWNDRVGWMYHIKTSPLGCKGCCCVCDQALRLTCIYVMLCKCWTGNSNVVILPHVFLNPTMYFGVKPGNTLTVSHQWLHYTVCHNMQTFLSECFILKVYAYVTYL